jgi:DNA-nicking Smr family endonuclease
VKRPRLPTAEEKALWRETTKHDTRFRGAPEPEAEEATMAPAARAPQAAPVPPAPVTPAKAGRAHTLPPLEPGDLSTTDGNTARRLKRGQIPVEATLDLHGMTREEAHTLLLRRLPQWVKQGKRCACIITGKGRGGEGVLKREVPRWLAEPPLRAHVIALTMAPERMGGAGAMLVLLKRIR